MTRAGMQKEDPKTVVVTQALAKPEWRRTFHFMRGMIFLTREIERTAPAVEEIRMSARSADPVLRRLYSKFASAIGERTMFGEPSTQYAARFRDGVQYVRKLEERR